VASTGATALSANTIVLTAASATSTSSGSTDSFGASVGYQIGLGGQGPTASLNIAAGQNQATSTSLLDTHVTGSNVSIYSKGDTTLAGATVTGDTVRATVGGDLTIQTVAGTTGSASNSSWSVNLNGSKTTPNGGGSATSQLGAGFTIGSGSGSTSWIDELSGIAGGDVKVDVTGHTQLNAGIVGGDLTTGTLGYTNLTGHDTSQQIDVGLSGSTSWTGGNGQKTSLVPDNGILQGSYSSTDKEQQALATVTGNVTITDKAAQTQDVSGINKDASKALTVTKNDQTSFNFYASSNSIEQLANEFQGIKDASAKLEANLINVVGLPSDVAKAAAQDPELAKGQLVLDKLNLKIDPNAPEEEQMKAAAKAILDVYPDFASKPAASTDPSPAPSTYDGLQVLQNVVVDGQFEPFEDVIVARFVERQMFALKEFEDAHPGVIDAGSYGLAIALSGPLAVLSQVVGRTVLKQVDKATGGHLDDAEKWLQGQATSLVQTAHTAYYNKLLNDNTSTEPTINDTDAGALGALLLFGGTTALGGKFSKVVNAYVSKVKALGGKLVSSVVPKKPVITLATLDAFKSDILSIRSALPSALRKGGNMAVAEVDIPGVPSKIAAHSRIDEPTPEQTALGIVGESSGIFTTSSVPSKNGVMTKGEEHSENKILDAIAQKLGDNPNATGTISLFTERPTCESCGGVIDQFKAKYPKITINVSDNGGVPLIPIKPGQ
jgi:hypothetical protein